MEYQEILTRLHKMASDKYKQNVIKLGIPEENSIGVSTGEVRKLAKEIGKSNELAYELWQSGYHEAKILAILLFETKKTSIEEVEQLFSDVYSWDLCDHICKNLALKINGYEDLIQKWAGAPQTYKKRAAFTLIAGDIVQNKASSEKKVEAYLALISQYSEDEREHVKKAISWALREIGKKDFDSLEKAIVLAHELKISADKAQRWIGKDALKELENLVQTEGRKRLISSNSKMGGKL